MPSQRWAVGRPGRPRQRLRANLNRGNWATLENAMAECRTLPAGRMRYAIGVSYPDDEALVPDRFTMEVVDQESGVGVFLAFQNVDDGGSGGDDEVATGVDFLEAAGCD
jgi:hypothetical protein